MQAIDPAAWQKFVDILGGETESVQEVADLFLEESKAVGEELVQAIEEGDPEMTRRLAHRLKSSARQLGALGLADVAQDLEDTGARGDVQRARELAPDFQRHLERARDGVAKRLVA